MNVDGLICKLIQDSFLLPDAAKNHNYHNIYPCHLIWHVLRCLSEANDWRLDEMTDEARLYYQSLKLAVAVLEAQDHEMCRRKLFVHETGPIFYAKVLPIAVKKDVAQHIGKTSAPWAFM